MTASVQSQHASALVSAVEGAWHAIQLRHPEVPDVMVTVGIGVVRGGLKYGHFAPKAWQVNGKGHGFELPEGKAEQANTKCARCRKAKRDDVHTVIEADDDNRLHELFVGGEGLQRGARAVMGTLIHESVHAFCAAEGIQDTSRQHRYHNTKFRDVAESFGINVEHSDSLGYSTTTVPDECAAEYADAIRALDEAITTYRKGFFVIEPGNGNGGDGHGVRRPAPTGPKAPGLQAAYVCECIVPRRFRMARSVFEQMTDGGIVCEQCGAHFAEAV